MYKKLLLITAVVYIQCNTIAQVLYDRGKVTTVLERTIIVRQAPEKTDSRNTAGTAARNKSLDPINGGAQLVQSRALNKNQNILSTATGVNLTPYQPTGWGDKIVVYNSRIGSIPSSFNDATTIYNTDSVFVAFSVANIGSDATSSGFYTKFYVDDVETYNVYHGSLSGGYHTSWFDGNIGLLSTGTHTFKVTADANYDVYETDETDNTYTRSKTISPSTGVNLAPYQPSGWSNKIIIYNSRISSIPSSFSDASPIYNYDSVFVAFSVANIGSDATSSGFYTKFYVDDVEIYNVYHGSLSGGYHTFWYNGNIGLLNAGTHTFRVIADANYDIYETDETDNTYQRSGNISTGTALTTPSLISPSDGAQVTPPVTFQWSNITEATVYDIEIGSDVNSNFESKILSPAANSTVIDTLAAGTAYSWRVRARNLSGSSSWTSFNTFTTTTSQTISQKTAASFSSSPTASTDYRLITVPTASSMSVSSFLTGVSKTDYRIFRDNGGAPPNHLTELSSSDVIGYGEGFWLVKKSDFVINTTLVLPTVSNGVVALNIRAGWNIIGDPFTVSVPWSNITSVNSLTGATLWAYNGGFAQTNNLEPFTGYYYFSGSTTLNIPYPFSYSSSIVQKGPKLQIGIVYTSSINKDESSFIGIDAGVNEGLNQFDLRKPPIFDDQGYVYFDKPEWDNKYSHFASDVRPQLGEGQTWSFLVYHPSKETGSISVQGINQIPQGYKAVLVNKATGVITQLERSNKAEFSSGGGNAAFELIIGTANYIKQKTIDLIPAQFELFQNYPNPFNPATGIRFSLPQDAFVMLKVYDILGRNLTTLSSEVLPAGNHQYYFDGRNYSSGTFFYVLQVYEPGMAKRIFSSTKKMILVK